MKTYLGWTVDFTRPPGAAAFTGPESVSWRVFKNPLALAIGGVAAVLLEFADPKIRSGVWTHSTFRTDPIGRSRRTAMAAMIGVYAPREVARRVIQGVTNMHARVSGATPAGAAYTALDPDLLDWVSATAGWGFVTAYDRFVAPLTQAEKAAFHIEGEPVARLYGVRERIGSEKEFLAMLAARMPGFEAHPILEEFLHVIASGRAAPGVPGPAHRAVARAAVSLLPMELRHLLGLGPAYDLSATERGVLKGLGGMADRVPVPGSPPVEACRRLGLPGSFLHRGPRTRAGMLAAWRAAQAA